MKYILIILSLFLVACSGTEKSVIFSTNSLKVKVVLPDGFKKEIIELGQEKELRFVYADSSIVYINDEEGIPTINYKNMIGHPKVIKQGSLLISEKDSLLLSGLDLGDKHWKNLRLKSLNIGYLNVDKKMKSKFDEALATFIILRSH